MEIPEHPAIENTLRTGYPDGTPEYPRCPICGSECEDIYYDSDGDIVGCEKCIRRKNAWEVEACL